MSFPDFEPEPIHIVYVVLSGFLILYALFSELIKNKLHLSEPPLALLVGITFGALSTDVVGPIEWRFDDRITQQITRIIVGLQVFTVGIDLPAAFVRRHWRSLFILLVPVMIYGWFVSAGILYGILNIQFSTALIIAATLTPTDPVLSASVLGEAKFSSKVPKRLRRILSAESGCNDGTAFPFLYAAIYAVTKSTTGDAAKSWFLEIIFWECLVGTVIGVAIGITACKLLRFSEKRGYVQESTLFVFYFLLAIFCVGVGSILGLDDFLVAFSAGSAFAWDGWFSKRTHKMKLPSIIDLLLNSATFVYFGTLMPWDKYTGDLGAGKLIGCVILILLLRRLPALIVVKRFLPSIHTYGEAIFAGHFGPMGLGALFLAIEAMAQLETGSSIPLSSVPDDSPYQEALDTIWPVVCFIVLGSIVVHGFSALAMWIFGHFFIRADKERAPLVSAETDRLYGMSASEALGDDDPNEGDSDSEE